MTTERIEHVTLTTAANVYFDGRCVSHGFTLADGSRKSVGVVLPATLTFTTGEPEVMECVAGRCEYRLAGSDAWHTSGPGERFAIPAHSSFELRASEPYHYLCHYG